MLLRRSGACCLDSVHGPLDCCRDKRLLNTLDRDTNQYLRPEEHQTCQDWNFDLHRFTVIFLSIDEHGKARAKLDDGGKRTK
jgi:hypothetical protein